MLKVLFICTANSCRSQMAEGFARAFGRGVIEAQSAGLISADVQPRAISVMKEMGIDISKQKSKLIEEDVLNKMDVVITLCRHAEELCPRIPSGIKRLHWPIKDPVGTMGTEEQIIAEFRRARNEIRDKVLEFIGNVQEILK